MSHAKHCTLLPSSNYWPSFHPSPGDSAVLWSLCKWHTPEFLPVWLLFVVPLFINKFHSNPWSNVSSGASSRTFWFVFGTFDFGTFHHVQSSGNSSSANPDRILQTCGTFDTNAKRQTSAASSQQQVNDLLVFLKPKACFVIKTAREEGQRASELPLRAALPIVQSQKTWVVQHHLPLKATWPLLKEDQD